MNKVFALFVTIILSSCPLSAAQFGPGNGGNAQGMGGGFGNGDGFDQGGDNGGGIDGPDDMDNLQPPGGNNSPFPNAPQGGGQKPPAGMDGGDYGDPNDPSGINDDGTDFNNGGSAAYSASAPGARPNAANPQGTSHQQKLKGMDYVRQLQNALLEGNKKSLCDEGGVCRKNFGEGCKSSKNFLSVCATICSDIAEFRGSHCLSEGAKRYKMNPQTMVYNARPDKQKPAETTAQHIAIQLREGRKALRDDKRLFFNTFCIPPAVQMIPDNDRTELALACLDFLYNGYPPESAVTQVKTNAFVQAPQAPTMCPTVQPQPAPPPPPPPAPAPATNDDVATPLGGLANAGVDKGAQYDGKLPAIVEDKEGEEEDCEEPKKKVKKNPVKRKAKAKKKTASKPTASAPAPQSSAAPASPAAVPASNSTPTEQASAGQTDSQGSSDSSAEDSKKQDDDSSKPAAAEPQPADAASPAEAPQTAQPNNKKKNLLSAIGGKEGIGNLLNKITKKKQANPAADGDQEGGDADAAADNNNKQDKISGAVGKFLKF